MTAPCPGAALLAVVAALAIVPAGTPSAQDIVIERWAVAGGGDVYTGSADGAWSLSGTLGEWSASGPQHGGSWTLTGGFWAGSPVVGGEATAIFRDGFEAE